MVSRFLLVRIRSVRIMLRLLTTALRRSLDRATAVGKLNRCLSQFVARYSLISLQEMKTAIPALASAGIPLRNETENRWEIVPFGSDPVTLAYILVVFPRSRVLWERTARYRLQNLCN